MRIDPSPLVATIVLGLSTTPTVAQAPIPSAPRPDAGASTSVLLRADTATVCDGEGVMRRSGDDIAPGVYNSTVGSQTGQRVARAVLSFRIDAEGRTLDIRPVRDADDDDGPLATLNPTVGPVVQATLAGWRFTPGARGDCRLTIRYVPVPVDRADPDLLVRYYAVTRYSGVLRDAVAKRLAGPDADCDGRARLRKAGYPDFTRGPRRPGIQDWTVVRWNIAEDGSPTDIETLGSSGDSAFDTEARDAMGRSRGDVGMASTACLYNWYRNGAILPTPPIPPAPADLAADCPKAVLDSVRFRNAAIGPEAFLSRGIEGWALVRFDIAPWGDVGNVAVIEAQPAQAFGDAALALVSVGRADPGSGAVRCVQPVHYRVPMPD